jgi:hypothetical protein
LTKRIERKATVVLLVEWSHSGEAVHESAFHPLCLTEVPVAPEDPRACVLADCHGYTELIIDVLRERPVSPQRIHGGGEQAGLRGALPRQRVLRGRTAVP